MPVTAYAAPASWEVVSINPVGSNPSVADMDGGRVVWTASVGTGTEVFLYDRATNKTKQLTSDGLAKSRPRIDGDYVVWRAGAQSIMALNLKTDTQWEVAHNAWDLARPWVSDKYVFWQGVDDRRFSAYFAADLTSKAIRQLTKKGVIHFWESYEPKPLSAPFAAWSDSGVYLVDLRKDVEATRISTDSVSIDGVYTGPGHVMWGRHDGAHEQVVVHDLATGRTDQLTSDEYNSYPEVARNGIAVNDHYTVWISCPPMKPHQLMGYNFKTKSTVHISAGLSGENSSPALSDDFVAWKNKQQIMVYHFGSGRVSRLSQGEVAEPTLMTAKGRDVLWGGKSAGGTKMVFLLATAQEPLGAEPFADVTTAHPYHDAIQRLYDLSIIGGYGEGGNRTFRPDAPVLRAQFAKMICGSLDLWPASTLNAPFNDLGQDDPTNLYPHQWVAMAAQKGITNGTGGGKFSPYEDISRAQMVSMVVRGASPGVLIYPPRDYVPTLGNFSENHAWNMALAECSGLLAGLQGFGPKWDPWAPASRGEVAQILSNLRVKMANSVW